MSFYGGKEGRSFIIAREFPSIQEMAFEFAKGPSYSEVNFDEYVLINTYNKQSPDNGKIFRRGYDYNSDRYVKAHSVTREENSEVLVIKEENINAGGAVYIGTIVGPAGRAPVFTFGHYEDVLKKSAIAVIEQDFANNSVVDMKNYLATTYKDGKVPMEEPINTREGAVVEESEFTTSCVKIISHGIIFYFYYDLLSYNDSPEDSIGWYPIDTVPAVGEDSFRPDKNLKPGVVYKKNEDGSLYYQEDEKGRKHLVPDVDKYQDTIDWSYCSIRNENNEDSTAYVGFTFGSPVVEYEAETVSPYYNRSDAFNGGTGNTNNFNNLNLVNKVEQYLDGSGIDEHPFYSKWELKIPKGIKGESIKNIYLVNAAEEHNIKKFKLDENGNLTYNSIGEIQVEDYVENITVPEGMSAVDIESSRDKWVIVFDYVCYDRIPEGEKHTIYLGDFNKLDGISLEHYGELVFNYSHNNTERTPKEDWIHWIDKMEFADDGTVTVTFNDNSWDVLKAEKQDAVVKGVLSKPNLINWITNVDFAENGTVTVDFNNNNLFNGKLTENQLITWMTDFSLNEETGELIVNFNNNRLVQNISKSLQWVKDIVLAEDGTLTTDYTSLANRVESKKLNWIKSLNFNSDTGRLQIVMNNDNYSNIDKTLNYTKEIVRDLREDSSTYNHLLILHSDPSKAGALSYNNINGWNDLGGLSYMMAAAETDSNYNAKQQALSPGGIWFITKEVNV